MKADLEESCASSPSAIVVMVIIKVWEGERGAPRLAPRALPPLCPATAAPLTRRGTAGEAAVI